MSIMKWENTENEKATAGQLELPLLKTQAEMIYARLRTLGKLNARNTQTHWTVKIDPQGFIIEAMRFPAATQRLLDFRTLGEGVLDIVTQMADEMERELVKHVR